MRPNIHPEYREVLFLDTNANAYFAGLNPTQLYGSAAAGANFDFGTLGAGFPVPTVDREQVYELQLYSPNNLTRSVNYTVIRYSRTNKTIAAIATGTITTKLPAVTQLLGCVGAMSVGGTSSVVGVALMGILTAREY